MRSRVVQVASTSALLGLACALSQAAGAPTTDVLQVSARIESGCRIVGQWQASGVDFGDLDFATHPSLFNQPLTAGSRISGSTLQLKCSGVVAVQISADAGMHAAGLQRRLASGSQFVPYELFLDAAGTEPLLAGTPRSVPISANGDTAVVDLALYGRIPPAPGSYTPGVYEDRVQITVSW
jgi:spore coat protein U-like protein